MALQAKKFAESLVVVAGTLTLSELQQPNGEILLLYDFVGAFRRRLLLLAMVTIACGGAMGAAAFVMKPTYRSHVILAPVSDKTDSLIAGSSTQSSGNILSALTGMDSQKAMQLSEEMTVLRSREFTEKFIIDNNLLPVLFSKLWDSAAGHWRQDIKAVPTLERGFIAFDKIRKVDFDDSEQFVTVQIDWTDRFAAANWANQMATRLNQAMRERAIVTADITTAYLEKELEKTSGVEARSAISRLLESQIKRKMLARVSEQFDVRVVEQAMVAEAEFPQRPNKVLMVGLGLVFGFLLGVAVSLWAYRRELASKGILLARAPLQS